MLAVHSTRARGGLLISDFRRLYLRDHSAGFLPPPGAVAPHALQRRRLGDFEQRGHRPIDSFAPGTLQFIEEIDKAPRPGLAAIAASVQGDSRSLPSRSHGTKVDIRALEHLEDAPALF